MKFILEEFCSTLEIKKSKFIAYLVPYKDFDNLMQRLKSQHPKARHFVYAYRYLNEFDQIVENSSDDGEPKGTSGKPSLSALAGADMINTGVIIVRYFGGIRLGTGGLVRAYSDAVNQVINESKLKDYVKLIKKSLVVQYNILSQIEYIIAKYEISIYEKKFDKDITLILEASNEEFSKLSSELFRELKLEDI